MFPSGEEIGIDRTPSFQYPSDHFSLVCDIELQETVPDQTTQPTDTAKEPVPSHQL